MKKKKFIQKSKTEYRNSGYSEGGSSLTKPTLREWVPKHYSSKLDLESHLNLLRDRSYDLSINSPVGAAAIATMVSGVVGSGLEIFPTPDAKELNLTPEAAREWSRRVKSQFEMWANSLECDFNRRNNFGELAQIAFRAALVDGDCFCLLRRRAGLSTLKLQLVEAARVSNPITEGGLANGVEMLKGTHRIIKGIEVDASGRMVGVWISNKIWNEPTSLTPELKWQRVKIIGDNGNRNLLHICRDLRPEQFRGEPLLAPVIETLKQIARYSEAELTSAIIKNFFSLFFYQPQSNFDLNQILPDEELDLKEYKLGAGTISALPRGVDVKAIENNNAQSTFESFVTQFLKMVGAALQIPFEVLLSNFQSSYSASRAAIIAAEQTFYQRRKSFVVDFCAPIYEMWLTEQIATGRIDAPGFFDDPLKKYCYCNADWRTAKRAGIDPAKEATAAQLRIAAGISTREIESISIGNDFWQVAEQLKLENEMLKDILPKVETAEKVEEDEN